MVGGDTQAACPGRRHPVLSGPRHRHHALARPSGASRATARASSGQCASASHPEQGKGIEYEFDLLLELSADHIAQVIKDRTGRFQDRLIDKPDETFGKELGSWLSGEPAQEEKPKRSTRRKTPKAPEPTVDASVRDLVAKIVARAESARAWGQADEYVRKHFDGREPALRPGRAGEGSAGRNGDDASRLSPPIHSPRRGRAALGAPLSSAPTRGFIDAR